VFQPPQAGWLYSESLTCAPQAVPWPCSPASDSARCENRRSGEAPCQCIVSGGILTVSPGFSTCGFSPLKQMRSTPDKQKSVCPTGWECHAVRAPRRERNDRTSKARRRLGGDHRILEHDPGEGLGGAPPGVARPGANDSGLYWHCFFPSGGDGLATAQIMTGEHSGMGITGITCI
jgi:hypothetical protein